MIQVIRYKCCNKIYAAANEPYCYTEKDWIKDVRKSALDGDKIEMIENGSDWKFEKCTCNIDKITNPNQLSLL